VVEVKSHLRPDDVFASHRKAEFPARRLGRPLNKFPIRVRMGVRAEALLRQLDIHFLVRSYLP
jgi:hypothetical protein